MTQCNKMFGFIKRCFFTALAFLSTLTSINLLSCISMNNQKCKVRPEIVNINGDGHVCFYFGIKTGKCRVSCKNINNPYARLYVPDVVKTLNVKVFNLMTRLTKQGTQNRIKGVNANVDSMGVFVIRNNIRMMINAGVNAKN